VSLSRLAPGGGDDPALGTYRPPRLYRLVGYATPVGGILMLVLTLGPFGFLSRVAVPFIVAFVAGVLNSGFYYLWVATQRVVLSRDGIEHWALGTTKFIRYDEIVSIRRRDPMPFDLLGTTAFTRLGDARGTRILLTGFVSQYGIITQYLDSRIGDRKLKWCPWTGIEYLKWGTAGVMVVCFVVMLLFKGLWR